MIRSSVAKIVCFSSLVLMFSCNDLKKISNQMETVKGNQDIIIKKQKEVDTKLIALQKAVSGLNFASNKSADPSKKQQQKPLQLPFVNGSCL